MLILNIKFLGGRGLCCVKWSRRLSFSCSIDSWQIYSSKVGLSVCISVASCMFMFRHGHCMLLNHGILSLGMLLRSWYPCLLLIGLTKEVVESMIFLSASSRRSRVLRASIESWVHWDQLRRGRRDKPELNIASWSFCPISGLYSVFTLLILRYRL